MRHRSRDGERWVANRWIALGHLHAWSTEEEVGERQPLEAGPLHLAVDGRVDNRDEVWRQLQSPPPLASMSDAALLLALFQARGADGFGAVLGSFAIIVADFSRRTVWMARDLMGGRSISFFVDDRWLVAASEAQAVVAHHAVPRRVDDDRLAGYFAVDDLAMDSSFFQQVQTLAPGEIVEVTPERLNRRRLGELKSVADPTGRHSSRRHEEWCERFRDALDASVACRSRGRRSAEAPGVLLSGGLDSVPIVTSLTAQLSASPKPISPIPTFSWTFDRHRASDERQFLHELERSDRLLPTHIPCDDASPDLSASWWPIHPATPEQNPYRRFHQRAYRAAEEAGVNVLLSGMCGDQLYSGTEHWLADLMAEGRWGDLATEVGALLRNRRLVSRTTVRGLIPARGFERLRGGRFAPWLTPYARQRLERSDSNRATRPEPRTAAGVEPDVPSWVRRPRQYRLLTSPMNGHGLAIERYYAHRHGVEPRYPLRDRRLVELMLSVPTSCLVARGISRPIVREALADRLPASVRERRDKASFESVLREGLFRGPVAQMRHWLSAHQESWSRFVRPEWLRPDELDHTCSPLRLLVAWHCVGFASWSSRMKYS